MNLLIDTLLNRRWLLIAMLALVTALAAWGASGLGFDDNYKNLFRAGDGRSLDFELLGNTFGAGDADCVILLEADDMLARPALEAVRQLHDWAADLPGVESVVSLYSVRQTRRVGRYFLPLFPGPGADDELWERAYAAAKNHPLVVEKLLSADRRASLVLVRLAGGQESVDRDVEPVLKDLRRVVRETTAGTGVKGRLTGMPAIRVETIRRLQREHVQITAIGVVLSTLVSWFLLRRIAAVLLVVTPALLGVLWTLGAMGWGGKNLDAVNIVLPALVLVIGVTDSIHLLFHFREAAVHGATPLTAIVAALRQLGGACALTATTTAIGFASLAVSPDPIIREFGKYGAIGVLLTFLSVITLLPLLCSTRLGPVCLPQGNSPAIPLHGPWLDRWLDLLAPRAGWVLSAVLVAGLGLGALATRIRADYHFLENLTEASESFAALRLAEELFGGGPLLQVLVRWPETGQLRSQETLDLLAEVHAAVEASPVAAAPVSLLSLLESLPEQEGGLVARFADLRYFRAEQLRTLVREDERLALVTAYAPDAGAAQLRAPLDALDAELRRIEQRHPGYELRLTGFAVVSTYRATSMIMNLLTGLTLELVFIFIVIALALRSILLGLVSFPSNILPMIATAAAIVAAGLPLRYATVLAFNICLGVAVDDTIHFLSRYRRELAESGDRQAAIRSSFHAVAPVMLTQTILMLTGFGAGLFCSIPTIRAFSATSCLALVFALASEAIVLPSLLFCIARLPARRDPAKPKTLTSESTQ